MDSEEEMQDALCGTSEGDDYYGDDDAQDYESDDLPLDYDNVDEEYAADDIVVDDSVVHDKNQLHFVILSEKDIRTRQEDAISSVETVLSIPKTDASILLRNYEWCVNRVNEEWFADEANVRQKVGLLQKPEKSESLQNGLRRDIREIKCGICLEYHPTEMMQTAYCNHYYCLLCWTGYIRTSISDGPGCLSLRCPNPDCNAAVREELIISLSSEEEYRKYRQYILRSYVEANRKVKWCPAPGCEYAVEYTPENGLKDVICGCGYSFCWNCCEEAHRPVECSTVALWILKNSAESENMNWILANSKPCPKCKRPIEKNQGCMHITCTPPCKYEFCWLCLGAWSEHGERTGGFYACNRYEAEKKEGKHDESERRREMAKNSLERYTHYYERWASNEQSRSKAINDLQQMQESQMEQLSDKQSFPVSQLNFVTEAWLQIVECRRVLKWTYAYGFYLSEEDVARKHFFEYLQGEAEAGLERLHKCAEKDIKIHLEVTDESSFNEFRIKLADLTSVTKNYFQNLVQALENGLADVDSSTAPNSKHQSCEMGRSSRSILDWEL